MKILYAITKSEIGGAQTHVAQLVAFMRDKGCSVGVMAQPGGWLEEEVLRLGADFFPLPCLRNSLLSPLSDIRTVFAIRSIVRKYTPDIVHCHSSKMGALARIVIRGKIPTIYTAHGWVFSPGVSFARRMVGIIVERLLSCFAHRIICVSDFDRRLALRYGVGNKGTLVVVYNGVAVPPRQSSHVQDKHASVLFVGRIARQKDPFLLVSAASVLRAGGIDNFSVRIVGGGPLIKELRDYVHQMKAEEFVSLAGEIPPVDMEKEFLNASLFVLTSRHEGFPYTILEAMSYGLPVVASDVGGVREAIAGCGVIVSPKNEKELVQHLARLICNPIERKELGASARDAIRSNFTVDQMCGEIVGVYDDVFL